MSSDSNNDDYLDGNVKLGKSSAGKLERLIDWNTESLMKLLQQIMQKNELADIGTGYKAKKALVQEGKTPLEDVKEIIQLPDFNKEKYRAQEQVGEFMNEIVARELRDYVSCVASMYRDNPFHNFEHASHVLMSVSRTRENDHVI